MKLPIQAKIVLFLLLFVGFWVGCKEDDPTLLNDETELVETDSTSTEVDEDGLPQYPVAIDNYVLTNYAGTTITNVVAHNSAGLLTYEVTISNGTLLLFSETGNILGLGENDDILIFQLPPGVIYYISNNYPNAFISEAELLSNGNYEVNLSNNLELVFNPGGAILNLNMSGSGGADEINISSIPAQILAYIALNYPGQEIDKAKVAENGNYEIEFEDDLTLYFDSFGLLLFVESDDDVAPANLPPAIQDYVAENYPGAYITEAEIESNGIYEVELSNGIELAFSASGEILNVDTGENSEGTNIPIAQIPNNILTYIATNFPAHIITDAEVSDDGNYEIWLNGGIKLYFNYAGNFLYEENEFELIFTNLSLPDTVTIGQTVTLSGTIENRSINPLNAELNLKYGIEDVMPANLSNTTLDGVNNLSTVVIPPKGSSPFTTSIQITPDIFNASTYDIAVVWPDVVGVLNVVVLGNGGYNATTVFVQNP